MIEVMTDRICGCTITAADRRYERAAILRELAAIRALWRAGVTGLTGAELDARATALRGRLAALRGQR